MRGENEKLQEITVIKEKKRVATALIIDKTGAVQFHIVSTWWAKGIIICFGIMLSIVLVLVLLVILNKAQIDDLKKEIKVHQESNSCCRE